MTRTSLICLSLALLAAPVAAQDDDVPPLPPPEEELPLPPPPEAEPEPTASDTGAGTEQETQWTPVQAEGVRTHDGFHLRVGLGFGALRDTISAEISLGVADVTLDGKASGGSGAFHLAIGGEIAEGLILGGALMTEWVTDPTIEFEGSPVEGVEVGTLGMLGVMIDWYPDARGGFHFGGALAGARISTTDEQGDTTDADEAPVGGAAVLFVGYDFWVGEQWSLGVLGRFTGATLKNNLKHEVAAGSILFAVTYN